MIYIQDCIYLIKVILNDHLSQSMLNQIEGFVCILDFIQTLYRYYLTPEQQNFQPLEMSSYTPPKKHF